MNNTINQALFANFVDMVLENKYLDENIKIYTKNILLNLYSYIITIDMIIDNEVDYSLKHNPFIILNKSYENLINNINSNSHKKKELNTLKDKYLDTYFDTIFKEKKMAINNDNISLLQFENIAINKHIPLFFILDLINMYCNKFPINQIKNMMKHIFKSIQMHDDINDLNKDLNDNQVTYVISKTKKNIKTMEYVKKDISNISNKFIIQSFFALEEISDPCFNYIINNLNKANEIAESINLYKIAEWCMNINDQTIKWKKEIHEIRKNN